MRRIIAVLFALLLITQVFGLVCKIQPARADTEKSSESPISSNPQYGDSKTTENDQKASEAQPRTVQRTMTEAELQLLMARTGIGEEGQNYNQLVGDHGTGLAPPSEEQWKLIEKGASVIDLISTTVQYSPSSWDNTASYWFPPIGNQGSQGSCVAWAVGYYTKTFQEAKEHNWNVKSGAMQSKIASPSFIYNLINYGVDGGSYYSDAIGLICSVGASSLGAMPYKAGDYTSWPSQLAWKEAPLYRANASGISYLMLQDDAGLANLKTWLSSGNLAILSVDAYKIVDPTWGWSRLDGNDMLTLNNYVNPSPNHAGTIVGYNDNFAYTEGGQTHYGAFKIANSWGIPLLPSPFGWEHIRDGCYWISYEAMKQRISYCMIYGDLLDYTPELVATFGISHNKRGECGITVGAGTVDDPIVTKRFDSYIHGGNVPFCRNNILLDVTEFKNILTKIYDQQYFLQVYDGGSITVGTVTKFSINHAQSADTPLYTINYNFVVAYLTLTKMIVPDEYPTIQIAISSAWPDDAIFVRSGTYYENVIIDKAIELIGENEETTIIDGNLAGNVINITANLVKVSGFTIRRSGTTWLNNIGIYVNGTSSGNNLSGNIITGNGYGIRLDSSSNNTIDGNSISNNWGHGILLSMLCSNNSILRNNVTSNYYGITLDFSSNNNVLRNNRMTWNSHNFGCFNNWQLLSYLNDIDTSNTVDGKPVHYWINKSDVTVPLDAGYVALINCTRIAVHDLNLTRNGQGVLLAYTKDSAITKNSMTNSFTGIDIDHSSNNTLSDNVIDANIDGITLTYSSNNSIIKNSLTANSQCGIYTAGSSGNHIYRNNMNNTKQVLTYTSDVNVWDNGYPSGGNYWSDYLGTDVNGDGVGDTPYVVDSYNLDRYPLTAPWNPAYMCDGFESGSFSRWNGTQLSSGEIATVTKTLLHHGNYSARFASNGTGGTEWAYCYKNIGTSSELYVRAYFYVSTSGIVQDGDRICLVLLNAGGAGVNVAYAGWRNVSGVVRWYLSIRNGSSLLYADSASTPTLNTWYCVELHWKKDAVNGLGDLWINGAKVCSISGKNTAFYGDVTTARFGLPAVYYCGPTTVYCDCVRIATTYIDPEPAVTSLVISANPFSPNGDGSKDTTTIKAAFNVAVRWNLQIRNSSGTTLRTWTGTGTNLSAVWDGKNSTGFKVPDGTYTVRLSGTDLLGVAFTTKSATVTVDTKPPTVTGVSVYPASFKPTSAQTTRINYTLSESCYVTIKIYDSTGSLKITLLNYALQASGLNSVVWNGKDSSNTTVPPGTYTIKIYVVDKAGNKATPYPITKTVAVL